MGRRITTRTARKDPPGFGLGGRPVGRNIGYWLPWSGDQVAFCKDWQRARRSGATASRVMMTRLVPCIRGKGGSKAGLGHRHGQLLYNIGLGVFRAPLMNVPRCCVFYTVGPPAVLEVFYSFGVVEVSAEWMHVTEISGCCSWSLDCAGYVPSHWPLFVQLQHHFFASAASALSASPSCASPIYHLHHLLPLTTQSMVHATATRRPRQSSPATRHPPR